MIKRMAVTALLFVFATSVFAEEAQRYVVALRPAALRVKASALIQGVEKEPRVRDIVDLGLISGFAVELTAEEAAELAKSAGVRYVEPVAERHALGKASIATDATTRNLLGQTLPAGIDHIRARDVWGVSRGQAINVVVVDTGVDYTHPDIAPNWMGGYNAISKTNDAKDDNGHGTHVAGTIAAADNDFGVVGVAPNVRLWSVKVLNASGSGTTDKIIAALDWITTRKRELGGKWIVNLSLGSKQSNTAEQEAFTKAVDDDLFIVAASGNESSSGLPAPVGFPAGYPGVVAVGAVDDNSVLANFSNQGPELSVVAPGVNVLSSLRVGTSQVAAIRAQTAQFSAVSVEGSKKSTVSGEFVLCGLGRTSEFPQSVRGRIAVIRRGEITFAEKAKAAKAAGATAVVIINNDDPSMNWTLISNTDPTSGTFDWPLTIGITKDDGAKLLAQPGSIEVTLRDDDYGSLSGTSMASPHVAGAAALLWGTAPSATAANLRLAMTQTAKDLGASGVDNAYGAGLIDVLAAAKFLAPAAFSPPVTPETPLPSGRRVLRRG